MCSEHGQTCYRSNYVHKIKIPNNLISNGSIAHYVFKLKYRILGAPNPHTSQKIHGLRHTKIQELSEHFENSHVLKASDERLADLVL